MFRAYYAQFANRNVISHVAGQFSPEELTKAYAEDKHLNNINLARWDDAARAIYPWIDHKLVQEVGAVWSLSSGVCTVKTAALILLGRVSRVSR